MATQQSNFQTPSLNLKLHSHTIWIAQARIRKKSYIVDSSPARNRALLPRSLLPLSLTSPYAACTKAICTPSSNQALFALRFILPIVRYEHLSTNEAPAGKDRCRT